MKFMDEKRRELFKKIRDALKKVIINGRNLGVGENVEFDLLTEHFKGVNEIEILKKIEELYSKVYTLSFNEENAMSLPIVDDKVDIPEGTYFHVTKPLLSQMKNIGLAGLVASEWFGIIESEREGIFCTFLNTVRSKKNDHPNAKILIMKNECAYLGKWGECSIFFNKDNPLVQMLIRLDFFEYAHIKKTNPEIISQMFSKDEVDILEFIYKNSNGKSFHDIPNHLLGRDLWHAIPGGIPPMLVSGVCINMTNPKLKELQENIQMINECFPNAVIFDENQNVLAYPKNYQSQKGK